MKIGIIGGGAAGLVAAIYAKNENNEVIILEKNKECGKKLLATGNGKCNYWNADQALYHYESSSKNKIAELINKKTNDEVLSFFESMGILPKIKNGYYYPFSNQASTVRNSLVDTALAKKVIIKTEYEVEEISIKNNKFIINNELIFDKLVISTGSKASVNNQKITGYDFLKKLNHTIIKPLPALVQLVIKDSYTNKWKGIRTDVVLTHLEEKEIIRKEAGEIQLTDYGISGICTFNLSNKIARGLLKNKKEEVIIDFLPPVSVEILRQKLSVEKPVSKILNNLLNSKLVTVLLEETHIGKNTYFTDLDLTKQEALITNIKAFKTKISSTKDYTNAQVCSGGVSLDEVSLQTMESLKVKNLYIVGELLDITGDCGGYNLGIAWTTGLLAGKDIGKNHD